MKLHTESRIEGTIRPGHLVIHWMIEYAAELINMFKIVNNKSTPREALRGKHTLRRLPEFGENVLWLPETWESGRMEKLEPKFEKGIWSGVCPHRPCRDGQATGD